MVHLCCTSTTVLTMVCFKVSSSLISFMAQQFFSTETMEFWGTSRWEMDTFSGQSTSQEGSKTQGGCPELSLTSLAGSEHLAKVSTSDLFSSQFENCSFVGGDYRMFCWNRGSKASLRFFLKSLLVGFPELEWKSLLLLIEELALREEPLWSMLRGDMMFEMSCSGLAWF